MAIKNRLKDILKEKGMTQTDLAEMIGVTKATISNIINERSIPSLELTMDIAQYLDVPIERVFYKDVNKNYYDFIETISTLSQMKYFYDIGMITEDALGICYTDIITVYSIKHSRQTFLDYFYEDIKEKDHELYYHIKKYANI